MVPGCGRAPERDTTISKWAPWDTRTASSRQPIDGGERTEVSASLIKVENPGPELDQFDERNPHSTPHNRSREQWKNRGGGACARIDGIEMVRGGGGVPVMPVVGNEGRGIEQWVKEPLRTGPES